MAGDPKTAFRALKRRYGDLKWEKRTPLRLEPLRTRAEIEASIRIISIQGHGLLKLMYAVLLKRLIELDVRVMNGGTAQKPVLKLSKTMKRPLFTYLLKNGRAYFRPGYFGY
jgi:hypothetical protein